MKSSLSKRRSQIVFFSGLFAVLSLFFNNCGQSGSLGVETPAPPANDSQGVGGGNPPGGNPPGGGTNNPPNYSDMRKTVNVDAKTSGQVDILFVIDNSQSMRTEQANLADRFSSFIDQLAGLDWQIGIITTDNSGDAPLKDGRLIEITNKPGQYILTSKMNLATVKGDFGATIQRSETGSSTEQGIKGTYRALERRLLAAGPTPNAQLFRANATLVVVVVSDDNESPKDVKNDPAAEYAAFGPKNFGDNLYDYVKTSFGANKKFVFNSIVVNSGDSACLAINGNEQYGAEYEKLSRKTGGVIGTVCASDYGSQLKNIGDKVVEQVKAIALDCTPVDSNADGLVDLKVQHAAPNSTSFSPVPASEFTLAANNQLQFMQWLNEGQYVVDYRCKAP